MSWFARRAPVAMDDGQSPQAQAVRWLARRELGLLRRDENTAFERWREDPRNAAAWSGLQDTLERARDAAADPGIGRMRTEALAQARRGPLLLGNVPVAAAVALIAVLFVFALLWQGAERAAAPSIQSAMSQGEIYQTGKGEQRTVALADGSTLKLNTATRAQVVLTAQRRSVRLLQGQALFQVAQDKDRPFTVLAGPLEVTALGTQFDIRVERQRASVVLLEGRVRVEPLARQGLARVLPMLERHYLQPGEQLVAGAEASLSVAAADVEQSTSWQYGRLIFRGEPLGAAVAEFNRYSERQMSIADEALAALPVSGVFSVAHPENFLAAVSAFYPVQVETRSPHLSVLSLRDP